jgi:hypothetical protein
VCGSLGLGSPAHADDPFAFLELPSPGRTVAAELVDLDGDSRTDLFEVAFVGIPPQERRWIRVRYQRPDGGLGREPDLELPLPAEAAAYDLADVLPGAGEELLLLVSRGVLILTLAREATTHRIDLPEGLTIGAGPDERGFDRLALSTRELGPEPRILVPGLGEVFLFTPSGELVARLSVGSRANYFVQPPGAIMAESDIQLFFDSPRIRFGDVDGDGRADAVAASRHQIRVFLRRADGSLPREPDRQLWLARVDADDHVRGSGAVRSLLRDIDADGRLDLVIAQLRGGILDSEAAISVFLNRQGGWNLEAPDAELVDPQSVDGVRLLDLDGDGRLELLRIRVPMTVLELIEVLVTRALDAHVLAYGMNAEGRFDPAPRFERKLDVPLNFETGRIRGFLPSFTEDWNGDGVLDLVTSGDGSELEIFLGGAHGDYAARTARQALDVEGMLRAGDLDRDGLSDLVLFNPRRDGKPIRVGRNLGLLPGSPPSLRAAPED